MHYRPAEIYPTDLNTDVKKWYVHYSYMHPITGKFERFKVYEDINRFKGQEKIKYAEGLKDAVNVMLRNGYSPYDEEIRVKERLKEQQEKLQRQAAGDRSSYNVVQALNYFLDKKAKESGVSKSTIARYKSHVNLFKNWLNEQHMLLVTASAITADQILTFLSENNNKEKWSNKTYNNYLGSMQTAFNLLAKKIHGVIPHNPLEGAETKLTFSRKHAAYSDQQLSWVLTAVRNAKDVYLEGVILTVYYACVRSKAEMMGLKAGNVLYERNLIRLDAEETKAKEDQYIPLDPILKAYYVSQGYEKLPAEWYIFGYNGQPGPRKPHPNYYSERFKPYRDQLHLSDKYTLYGFKHTRIIHLAKAGVDPYAIIALTRHTTLDQLMTYLRDLGVTINFDAVKDSRKL